MEVWLESLSMHLAVGMPLPPDLVFDIHHYSGLSPSSSGSTTPEGKCRLFDTNGAIEERF